MNDNIYVGGEGGEKQGPPASMEKPTRNNS